MAVFPDSCSRTLIQPPTSAPIDGLGARPPGPIPLPLPGWTWRWAALIAAAFALAVVLAVSHDAAAARFAATLPRQQVRVWEIITEFGLSGYMFATSGSVVVAALLGRRVTTDPHRRALLTQVAARSAFFFASIAASGLAAQTIKHLVGRLRPRFLPDHGAFAFVGPSWGHGADSFPSGHTTSAFAAALALGLMLPRLRLPLVAAAVMIGISRVATGNHYPSDVICGATLGTGITAALAVWFARRGWVFRRSPQDR